VRVKGTEVMGKQKNCSFQNEQPYCIKAYTHKKIMNGHFLKTVNIGACVCINHRLYKNRYKRRYFIHYI